MKMFDEHRGHVVFSALIFHGLSVKNTRVLFPSSVETIFFQTTVWKQMDLLNQTFNTIGTS